MVKLLFSVMLEAAAGVSLAGLALALIVPALNYLRPAAPGSTAVHQAVIGAVIVLVTTAVVFRPGSAINRWRRR
jgi:hypothetical protein